MQISKMQEKIDQKLFVFEIIALKLVVKLSLLRREYLSSAAYKAFRLTKTDFFRLNYLPNDQ